MLGRRSRVAGRREYPLSGSEGHSLPPPSVAVSKGIYLPNYNTSRLGGAFTPKLELAKTTADKSTFVTR
ncbi:uncharacterized protein BO88DRAFT_118938 [Aspergillus vadensis CBS 113365]|uniref:Uncharacterized protein n=1 Tax=Aspergillus vadensis (strain CBS 113365 / IMI 142717 / IBT 24658) TaxID=1448311 RepID=A0A319B1C1_ASPVC|nr:hypothetical protein BO88DRAFT_118938 [Aspergillus vadensis CBS 113365]PYH66437.1 hypothetical protein BO88DRAFT_118938 [Aspergillus vadensis CBS 113365]